MGDGDPLNSDEFLIKTLRHEEVLRVLNDGSANRREVEEAADVSTSTAYRILGSFIDRGLLKKECGVYRLTPVGESVLGEINDFKKSVGRVGRTRPIAESVPDEVGFEPSLFKDGTVTVATPDRPYGPERRFMNLLRDADTVRFLGGSSAASGALGQSYRIASEGGSIEVVCPESVARANEDRFPTEGGERVTVLVHEDPSPTVALVDAHVCVGTHDSEKGGLRALADTDDPEAYDWSERVYERHRMEADEY
jgi:predicted transcriptional regulator